MHEQRGTDFVQSLERGLTVIRAFDCEHPALMLVELGYVHHDGREFMLRPSVLNLGFGTDVVSLGNTRRSDSSG